MTIKLRGTPDAPSQTSWAQRAGNSAYKRGNQLTVDSVQNYSSKLEVISMMRLHTREIAAVLTSVERGNPTDSQNQLISARDQVEDLFHLTQVTLHVQSCVRQFASSPRGLTRWPAGPVFIFSSPSEQIRVTVEEQCQSLTALIQRIEKVQAPILKRIEEENMISITPAFSTFSFPIVLIRIVAEYMG